ncbi:MAG: hypothetical protein HYX61_02125 [Gammaproteobacteria bacterium]|jgi:hypothetical protein|nr:hypothetical protein [Gammaproteobacteria bacterium]
MLGQDLDPELLQALEASQKEYEEEQKRKEIAIKDKPTLDNEEDEEFKKAIALSLESQPILTTIPTSTPNNSTCPSPHSEKETILLTRQLRFILKVPSEEIENCVLALQAQKHWDNSFQALESYEKSTKEYSAKGLITFMQEGPKTAVTAITANTTDTNEKDTNVERKPKRKKNL